MNDYTFLNPRVPDEMEDFDRKASELVAKGVLVGDIYVYVRRCADDGSFPLANGSIGASRFQYSTFDPFDWQTRGLPAGRYKFEMMTMGSSRERGVKKMYTWDIDAATAAAGASRPVTPAAPVQAVAPQPAGLFGRGGGGGGGGGSGGGVGGGDPLTMFILDRMNASDQRAAAADARTAEMFKSIIESTRAPAPVSPVRNLTDTVKEMMMLREFFESMSPRDNGDGGDTSDLTAMVKAGVEALVKAQPTPTMAPTPPAPQPAGNTEPTSPQTAPIAPASQPAGGTTPPAAADPFGALATVLLSGAMSGGEPELYAAVVSDMLETAGQDLGAIIPLMPAGSLTDQLVTSVPTLAEHRAFVLSVETELRKLWAEDEPPAPPTPAAPAPPVPSAVVTSKPAKAEKVKAS